MANEATKIFPRIQKLVSEGKGADLGCGPFKLSVPNAIGVDPGGYEGIESKPALEWLKEQSDASLDWVFSSHYLEHEPQHAAVLAQVNRVLKPGGSLLVYLPDKRLYKDANGNDPNGDHVNHWTPGLFVDEVIDHTDLQVVAIEKRHTSPPGHAFTGNGDTEHPETANWEYSFFVHAKKAGEAETAPRVEKPANEPKGNKKKPQAQQQQQQQQQPTADKNQQ
jgi:SAM-dependent methyltransferase